MKSAMVCWLSQSRGNTIADFIYWYAFLPLVANVALGNFSHTSFTQNKLILLKQA